MSRWQEIHEYWFGEYEDSAAYLHTRMPFWFQGDKKTDSEILSDFGGFLVDYDQGRFDWTDWKSSPKSFLSLIILFDQFPRNIYRGLAKGYSYDALSLSLSREFIGRGWLNQLRLFEKIFVLLPLEHSESLAVQKESVSYFQQLVKEGSPQVEGFLKMAVDFAQKHLDVIERFGRFPHRNKVLGRHSTSLEIAFLNSKEIVF